MSGVPGAGEYVGPQPSPPRFARPPMRAGNWLVRHFPAFFPAQNVSLEQTLAVFPWECGGLRLFPSHSMMAASTATLAWLGKGQQPPILGSLPLAT